MRAADTTNSPENTMSIPITTAATASAELAPAPIRRQWIISGTPEARSKQLARSHDGTTSIWVWECSAGTFNWHYSVDETITVISGEVFITDENQEECRLGQGDMGYFPSGSSCTWRVTGHIKKVAILRH